MKAAVCYRIGSTEPNSHLFDIEMLIGCPGVQQTVSLPTWIPGSYLVREFARHLQNLVAHQGRRACDLRQLTKNSWEIDCIAGQALKLSYRVYAFDASVRAAYLDSQRGFFNGTSVFLLAAGLRDQPHEVTVLRPPQAGRWKVATGLAPLCVDADGWGSYRAPDYDTLIDAPLVCGEFWSGRFETGKVNHQLVVSGMTRAFDGQRLLTDCERICKAAMRLWRGKAPHQNYVFLLHAVANGYGGLEHRNSSALICSRRDLPMLGASQDSETYVDLLGLIAHEYFHTWNVKRLRPKVFERYDLDRENYTDLLWFFEGFTSYFDELLLLRAGLLKFEPYLKRLAKTINTLEQTPGRWVQSVAQASVDAWVKYYRPDENTLNATVSYYSKGALIALCLDLSLRAEGHELAAVMRGLWRRCAGGPMTELDLLDELQLQTGRSWRAEIRAWVHSTKELPWARLLRSRGVRIDTEPASQAQRLGLQVKEGRQNVQIKSVQRQSAAEQAGMAAGDEWLAIETGRDEQTQMWRLKKLDELPLWLGQENRCRALICRDQRLHWLTLKLPPMAGNWRLTPGPQCTPWS